MNKAFIVMLIVLIILIPLPFKHDTIDRLKKIQYVPMQAFVYERGQARLAIIEPFGWTFLNLNTTIYIFDQVPGRCKQNQSCVIVLTPDMGYARPALNYQCYNATIASLCSLFKESHHETVNLTNVVNTSKDDRRGSFTIIDGLNFLLRTGLFKGS